MKKMVYVVTEYCLTQSGDDFDLFYTFDLEDARRQLAAEADRGYNLNHKSPQKVEYVIFGYEVNSDEIGEDEDYDINDPKSLYSAYALSQCCVEHTFSEAYALEGVN